MKQKIITMFAAAALLLGMTGCVAEDNPSSNGMDVLKQSLVGKWLYLESDGNLVETSESSVTTFFMEGSTLKACISISMKDYGLWAYKQPADVLVDGDKITVTMQKDDITTVEELTGITVSGDDLRYTSRYTILRNGEVVDVLGPYRLRCTKVYDDYSQIFIGRWEGTVTSDFGCIVDHLFCEEYLPNGTNIEYELKDGHWVEVKADYAEYFIDGNLLCTRWKYPGKEEERENSIFESYDGGTMIIKEMVARDGHLCTETSTLSKRATITAQPENATYTIGDTTYPKMSVAAIAANGDLTYEWLIKDEGGTYISSGIKTAELDLQAFIENVVEAFREKAVGDYTFICKVTDGNGAVESKPAILTIVGH